MRNVPPFANPFQKLKNASPKTAEFLGKVLGSEERARYEEMLGDMGDLDEAIDMGISPEERRVIEKRSHKLDQVTLRNIPSWERLPDPDVLRLDFHFEHVEDEFLEGCLMSDRGVTWNCLH